MRATVAAGGQASHGIQLGVVQEVLLALLAREPSHGYQLRAGLQLALGPLADALKEGQVYVTLTRLERAGLVSSERVGQANQSERKVYDLTPAGQQRVVDWLADTTWPKPAPAEFHLKLVAAAAAGLADPRRIVDAQRNVVLTELVVVQRAALSEPPLSVAGLLLEGVVLRLQADLHWLEACARFWAEPAAPNRATSREDGHERSAARPRPADDVRA
ncbi:PadR family transcriptional regulator [Cellulomonas sp. URHD0024]|uniref:PadR family transcriptional regulator n=1 Tax=Cellulomonas sp. URHD0024 TaxID=1302620 RepID=UPI000418A599|nr:PadR family transcriptional regulator [Cellulomonas sp. URHD0024]